MPNRGRGFAITRDAAVDQTLGGVEWKRDAHLVAGVATITASERSLAPEFPAKDAPAVQQALRELAHRGVYIVQTAAYRRTPQEVAQMLATPPVTARDYLNRGDAMIDAGKYADALAALDKALEKAGSQQPHSAWVLALRGIAHDGLGQAALATQDFDAARSTAGSALVLNEICWRKATLGRAPITILTSALADCDAALKLMPEAFQIMDSRALVLLRLGRNAEAVDQYGKALALDPKLAASLYGRALAEARLGHAAAQDRDVAAARAVDPGIADVFADFGMKADPAPAASSPPLPARNLPVAH